MKRVKKSDWTLARPGRGKLRVALDALLLLLALWGTVFTAVSAYDLSVNGLWLGSACLLFTAVSTLISSRRRLRWLWLLLLAALWGAAFWLLRRELLSGCQQIAQDALKVLSEVFDVGELHLPPVSVGTQRALTTLTLAMAVFPLGCLLSWSVFYARSALLTLLLGLSWSFPALLADVIPDWGTLMALVTCCCLLLLTSLVARHDPQGSARFTLLCLPAVVLLLAALTALCPQEDYRAPVWAGAVRKHVESAADLLLEDSQLDALFAGDALQETVQLDQAGPRQFSGKTVFTVAGDTPGRVYLRGLSAAVYTGTSWEPLEETVYARAGLDDGLIDDVPPLLFPSLGTDAQDYSELRIDYGNSFSGYMYAPYQLATAPNEVEGVDFRYDSHLTRRFGVREKNLFYRPEATPEALGVLKGDAASAEARYRDFVQEQYLDVPIGFQQTVDRWLGQLGEEQLIKAGAMLETGYKGPYAHALTTADFMAALLSISTEYDLDVPYLPEGEDFVDWFLTESHRGYCVHYASAGTLLLRLAGVPARYVEGYTAEIPAHGSAAVEDSAAHAWVEIYLDGYGWYPVDMTPPAGTGLPPHSALSGGPEEDPEEDPKEPDQQETEDEERGDPATVPEPAQAPVVRTDETEAVEEGAAEGHTGAEETSVLWLWIPLLLLALVATAVQSAVRRALLQRRLRSPDTNAAALAAYGALERLQNWGGELPQEALELARKARFSQHRLSGAERARMLALLAEQRGKVWETLPKWKRLLVWLKCI